MNATATTQPRPSGSTGPTLNEVLSDLDVRFSQPADREAVERLARESGKPRPEGGLIVGAVGNRLLAAASLRGDEVLAEPGVAGSAAAAVVRYEAAHMHRSRHGFRSTGSPS